MEDNFINDVIRNPVLVFAGFWESEVLGKT